MTKCLSGRSIQVAKPRMRFRSSLSVGDCRLISMTLFNTTILYFHTHRFAMHLRTQIAKAIRGGRKGKVTAVITDDIVK